MVVVVPGPDWGGTGTNYRGRGGTVHSECRVGPPHCSSLQYLGDCVEKRP